MRSVAEDSTLNGKWQQPRCMNNIDCLELTHVLSSEALPCALGTSGFWIAAS